MKNPRIWLQLKLLRISVSMKNTERVNMQDKKKLWNVTEKVYDGKRYMHGAYVILHRFERFVLHYFLIDIRKKYLLKFWNLFKFFQYTDFQLSDTFEEFSTISPIPVSNCSTGGGKEEQFSGLSKIFRFSVLVPESFRLSQTCLKLIC